MEDVSYDVLIDEPRAPGDVGDVSITVEDHFYIASVFGTRSALALWLREQEFHDLASYVRESHERTAAYISGMEVPRELRGKGQGGKLLTRFLNILAGLEVETVYLHAAPSGDANLEILGRFYERHGFKFIDVYDVYPVMRLDLA